MSQISLDFASAGAPTLWGSFEIKNVRLLQKMLFQYYGLITNNKGRVDPNDAFATDKLDSNPEVSASMEFLKLDKEKLELVSSVHIYRRDYYFLIYFEIDCE